MPENDQDKNVIQVTTTDDYERPVLVIYKNNKVFSARPSSDNTSTDIFGIYGFLKIYLRELEMQLLDNMEEDGREIS